MKRILFPGLLVIVLALLLGVGAVACGDDDDDDTDGGGATSTTAGGETLTLEAYLREVNDIQDGVTKATDAIGENSESAFSDPAKARSSLNAATDVAESAISSLQALTPPSEARTQHDALIAAAEDMVATIKKLSTELQTLQAGPAFDTFAADAQAPDSDLSKAIDKTASACQSMQAVAKENKINVDLKCPATAS